MISPPYFARLPEKRVRTRRSRVYYNIARFLNNFRFEIWQYWKRLQKIIETKAVQTQNMRQRVTAPAPHGKNGL
jgi:hypothetical protein